MVSLPMVDAIHSLLRSLAVVACIMQMVLRAISDATRAGLTAAETASLHAYPSYLLLSIAATELTVTVGMVWRRLRRAFFFLALALYVAIAYHFVWYHYLLFINTMGRFGCFGVLGKAAIVVGSMDLFAPMCGNILLCFLAVLFLGE